MSMKRLILTALFFIYVSIMIGIMYSSDNNIVFAVLGVMIGYKANTFVRDYMEAK